MILDIYIYIFKKKTVNYIVDIGYVHDSNFDFMALCTCLSRKKKEKKKKYMCVPVNNKFIWLLIILVGSSKGLRSKIPKQCDTKTFKLFNCLQYCAFHHGKWMVRFQRFWGEFCSFLRKTFRLG